MSLVPATIGQTSNADHSRWFMEEVRPHELALRHYLRRQFPTVDPDDVVQESYLKLLEIRGRTDIYKVKAYLFSIATHNALRTFQRREQLFAEVSNNGLVAAQLLDEAQNGAEVVEHEWRLDLIAEAIDRLPTRCRNVIRCAIIDGRSAAEIAAYMCLSENTVRVQMARGIKRCSQYLRDRKESP